MSPPSLGLKSKPRLETIINLAACSMLVSCLSYSSILKMEVIFSSETSYDFQRTAWHNIPEDTIRLFA
jgi:hypothetical protein